MNTILVIDIGTTLIKGVLFDEKGNILCMENVHYPLINLGENRIEQDPEFLWENVKSIIKKIVLSVDKKKQKIKAISLSSQGISIVPINKNGKYLYNMISWLDGRATKEVEEINKKFSKKDLFLITGKRLNAFYSLPKILWLKRNKKEVFANIYKILLPHDFVFFKLTGKPCTDHTMAAGTMLYDVSKRDWSKKLLDSFEISKDIMPDIYDAGKFASPVLKNLAEELNLDEKVKIVIGAQDQKCAAIGAGIKESTAIVSMGTCSAILVETMKPVFDPEMRIPIFSFVKKDSFVLEAVISTTGAVLDWMKNNIFDGLDYDEIINSAKKSTLGSNGIFYYPHFEGAGTPYLVDSVKGFIYGLSLSTKKEDILRAFFEGTGFQIRNNIEIIEKITKKKLAYLKIMGGGAKSDFWCDVIADIVGKRIYRYQFPEIASRGAAILGGIGSGIFSSIQDGYQKMNKEEEEIKPNKSNFQIYNEFYMKYLDIEKKFLMY